MRQYTCTVTLGGDRNHVVANKVCTIPEIALLRHIHGESSVQVARPAGDALFDGDGAFEPRPRTEAEERERLKIVYDAATPDAEPLVERLFGPLAALPRSLRDIGIDPAQAAAEMRRQADAMATAAANLDTEAAEDAPAEDETAFFEEEAAADPKAKKAA